MDNFSEIDLTLGRVTFEEDFLLVTGKDTADPALDSELRRVQVAEALERLVLSHMPTVMKISERFRTAVENTSLEFDDFLQAGVLGILRALKGVDETKPPGSFHAYVKFPIHDEMFKLSAEQSGSVRLADGQLKPLMKVRRIISGLGCGETLDQLLEREGMSRETFAYYHDAHTISSTVTLKYNTDRYMLTNVTDRNEPDECADPQEIFEQRANSAQLRHALGNLSEKDRNILELRFGLNGEVPLSLQAIADKYGVDESRISQIVGSLLVRLKDSLRRQSGENLS